MSQARGAAVGRAPSPPGAHPAPALTRWANGLSAPAGAGTGSRRAGSLPCSVPSAVAHPRVCSSRMGVASLGWEVARVALAVTFLLLLLLPAMAGDAGSGIPQGAACCAKRQISGLKAQHRAISPHARAEGCGAELNLTPHPRIPPSARCCSPGLARPCQRVPGGESG